MRALVTIFAAALMGTATLCAQTRSEPNLIFTIYGGTSTGHALWQIDRQPMPARGGAPPDTASLSRRLNSGLIAGLLTSLFPSPHFGVNVEIHFRTFGFDDQCTPVAPFQPDTPPRNTDLCNNITASANSGSVLTLNLGGTARIAPRGVVSPYVRAAFSISNTTISTIEVVEAEPVDTSGGIARRAFILDNTPRRTAVGATLGAGFTVQMGPAYQFRLEVRDDIATLERIVGPASAVAIAPTTVATFQRIGLLLGVDIVLEQKRTRRY